jgi:hypothetical protein
VAAIIAQCAVERSSRITATTRLRNHLRYLFGVSSVVEAVSSEPCLKNLRQEIVEWSRSWELEILQLCLLKSHYIDGTEI